ncbi:MAG: hypothetical protein ACRD0W_19605 [Acidimicrobiales bacterium]
MAVLGACTTTGTDTPGNAETDRIAQVVADAISHPRRETADSLVRAALATESGQDGRLTVIAADEIEADELTDPLARLLLRVQLDGARSGLASDRPITACYDAEFNFYGIIDQPRRTDCPSPDPEPIVPPPTSPDGPGATLPPDAPACLQATLDGLSEAERTDPAVVLATVDALALTDMTPEIAAGHNAIGVAVRSGDDCLLARLARVIEVWIPPASISNPASPAAMPTRPPSVTRNSRRTEPASPPGRASGARRTRWRPFPQAR